MSDEESDEENDEENDEEGDEQVFRYDLLGGGGGGWLENEQVTEFERTG